MSDLRDELIERLVFSGTIEQYGVVKERLYDPMTYSQEGLDDCCFHCGADPVYLPDYRPGARHSSSCVWVAAMKHLGHDLPRGHTVAESDPA